MKLSIVIPVFNEQDNLHLLHDRLTKVAPHHVDDFEIIFVNDGSTDRSLFVMRELSQADPHTKYVSLSRNFGHEIASTAGIDAATGDAVVLIDADLQDPPELIPELLAKWRQGAGVVYARRRRRDGESMLKKIAPMCSTAFFIAWPTCTSPWTPAISALWTAASSMNSENVAKTRVSCAASSRG